MGEYVHVHVHVGTQTLVIFLRKSDYLGCAVLLYLVVCLTLLASFSLPSHLSLKHVPLLVVLVCVGDGTYCLVKWGGEKLALLIGSQKVHYMGLYQVHNTSRSFTHVQVQCTCIHGNSLWRTEKPTQISKHNNNIITARDTWGCTCILYTFCMPSFENCVLCRCTVHVVLPCCLLPCLLLPSLSIHVGVPGSVQAVCD